MNLRRYEDKDFEAVCELIRENSESFTEEDIRQAVAHDRTWVAESDNKVIGHLIGITKGMPYIWNICVSPEFRCKGIATRLIYRFEQEFVAPFLWLHVRPENPAQKLYFDLGYRVTDIARDFYGEQQDGLVMVKRLM